MGEPCDLQSHMFNRLGNVEGDQELVFDNQYALTWRLAGQPTTLNICQH
jgi:hypothetical protein